MSDPEVFPGAIHLTVRLSSGRRFALPSPSSEASLLPLLTGATSVRGLKALIEAATNLSVVVTF